MDLSELKAQLTALGVPGDAYSLDGGLPNERYVIEAQPHGRWCVYYSERGLRTGLKEFESEAAACDCILMLIRRDLGI